MNHKLDNPGTKNQNPLKKLNIVTAQCLTKNLNTPAIVLAHSVISHGLIKMVTHLTKAHNYTYNLNFEKLHSG
jgi:hypothetical protein